MDSDKPIVYCGKGILERIKEEDISKENIKLCSEEVLIKYLEEIRKAPCKPLKEIIIIGNGLTDEQINKLISNFKTN